MDNFGLSIENFEGKLEPAYVNIKFKSLKEKAESEVSDTIVDGKNSIGMFLKEECMYT